MQVKQFIDKAMHDLIFNNLVLSAQWFSFRQAWEF